MEPLFRYGRDCVIVHLAGKSWELLRIPPLWHRCRVDTYAFIWGRIGMPWLVHRCRCGARRALQRGEGIPAWLDRNSRRRHKQDVFRYLPTEG